MSKPTHNSQPPTLPSIQPGKRGILAGRTGSGKSTLAKYLMQRSGGHWVIINPKWTKAFDTLPAAKVIVGIKPKEIEKSIFDEKTRFTIINPKADEADPETLDVLIQWLHAKFTDLGIYVDELYSVHVNGRAGPGLIGVLTRGRELGQTFLGATQRPAYLSKFLFSEADYICGMSLNVKEDRKRMYEFTGRDEYEIKLQPHQWLWYDVGADELQAWGPVPVD